MVLAHSVDVVRFGPYEIRLSSQELFKLGTRIKLPPQSFEVLRILLERSGSVVSRQEFHRVLWPSDTFVDFEHGLNSAMTRLRTVLCDDPENPRYIETLPRLGYRFIGSVDAAENSPPSPAFAADMPMAGNRASSVTRVDVQPSSRRTVYLVVTAVVVLVLALLFYGKNPRVAAGSESNIDSLAVLPFVNDGGDATTDYLGDGITESLISNLARVPGLKIKSRRSVFRYKGKDVDVRKVGRELGVSALVSGRVLQRGDNIEISAELIDARDSSEIWGKHYSVKSAALIVLQQQIAGDIVEKLRSNLSTTERQQVTRQGTQNPRAYELYLKGSYYQNKLTLPDATTAIAYLNQAIAEDPNYALAYSVLAYSYVSLTSFGRSPGENFSKSNAAARKAIQLDAALAQPHAVLGSNEMEHEWDFAGGETEYKKAFALDPSDANSHMLYAGDIALLGGKEQEAITEANLAHQLDPLSSFIGAGLGYTHIRARKYDEAIAICEKLATEKPPFAMGSNCAAYGYWGKRMYPQVIEAWKLYGQLSGDRNESEFASAIDRGFHAKGWKGALLEGIAVRKRQRKPGYSSAYLIAVLYADLGAKDQAFRWLETAYQERDWLLEGLNTDFLLDPLHSDPRFAELARKIGLPQ